MAEAPAFDPSKSFEPVPSAAPPFDPTKPFEPMASDAPSATFAERFTGEDQVPEPFLRRIWEGVKAGSERTWELAAEGSAQLSEGIRQTSPMFHPPPEKLPDWVQKVIGGVTPGREEPDERAWQVLRGVGNMLGGAAGMVLSPMGLVTGNLPQSGAFPRDAAENAIGLVAPFGMGALKFMRLGDGKLIGELPKDEDFTLAGKLLAHAREQAAAVKERTQTTNDVATAEQNEAARAAIATANLKTLWRDQGIHPAEAVHDAQSDAFVRDELTTASDESEGTAHGLGADVAQPMPSLAEQPAPPPGRFSAMTQSLGDRLLDLGRDLQKLTSPMTTGSTDSMAIAKDFANALRRNRWEWSRIDDDIASRFTPEQRERMWNAADEESVMRQSGEQSEHMGFATLTPEERQAVEDLQTRSQIAWLRARDLGMVEGEGLPAYTPRMIVNAAGAAEKDGRVALNRLPDRIGTNLRTSTAQLLHRKYLTAEQTEAAAKASLGEDAQIVRDIRVLPFATAKLEDAIAGRTLINAIRDIGRRTGDDTVADGFMPAGSDHKWFTVDHPAFKTWRPKFADDGAGHMAPVRDEDGNIVFEQVPLYVRDDFEGPLRAVLNQKSGALYNALMGLKSRATSLIMYSPFIHNAVEWGRALPAMPGKVASLRIYFDGNKVKNDPAQMREAIDAGMVPIGHRAFNQDITSIMEEPNLTPGRSLTAKVLGAVPGLFDPAAGTAVKRAIDKAGDFWHNTLLWDRVGDLQAGLYAGLRDDMLAKGVDRLTATRIAAHWANRYAGALPQEAMSDGARKLANVMMFSRSFTLGNLGVMKDMLNGLPRDVTAQIERDMGAVDPVAAGYAKAMARRKAMAVVLTDIALFYVGNSVLQSALNVLRGDDSLDGELQGYATRLMARLQTLKEHPAQSLSPLSLAGAGVGAIAGGPAGAALGFGLGSAVSQLKYLSSTYANEPGRQDRIKVGYARDGTAIYARNPLGKIGEEFVDYVNNPLDMMLRKQSTIVRPAWQIINNDAGFGRKIYDPDADTPMRQARNMALIAEHLAGSQLPLDQIGTLGDLVKGEGDTKTNLLHVLGPLGGLTFSKGAPGGPAVGELYHAREEHDYAVNVALPDIRRQILRGDIDGARQRMTELGIPRGLREFYIRTTLNPATRLGGRTLKDFYLYATPEQKQRLENAR